MLHKIGRPTRRSTPGLYRWTRIGARKASPYLGTKHPLRSTYGKVPQYLSDITDGRERPRLGTTPSHTKASRSFATEKQQPGFIGSQNLTRKIYQDSSSISLESKLKIPEQSFQRSSRHLWCPMVHARPNQFFTIVYRLRVAKKKVVSKINHRFPLDVMI